MLIYLLTHLCTKNKVIKNMNVNNPNEKLVAPLNRR